MAVCISVPGDHSFRSDTLERFLQPETRSSCLPTRQVCSRFGTGFDDTDWQELDAPFIVELFTVDILISVHRRMVAKPFGSLGHPREAPDASKRYANPSEVFHPARACFTGYWSSSRWGI